MKCPNCGSEKLVMSAYPFMRFGVSCSNCDYEFNNEEKQQYDYQQRLDNVLGKMDKEGTTTHKWYAIWFKEGYTGIIYDNNKFVIWDDNGEEYGNILLEISLKTVESLLKDLEK